MFFVFFVPGFSNTACAFNRLDVRFGTKVISFKIIVEIINKTVRCTVYTVANLLAKTLRYQRIISKQELSSIIIKIHLIYL